MSKHGCDLLVISPHTDDAEIGLGGAIALLTGRGRRVWAADLTRGELGSNATSDERWQEAEQASAILGLAGRIQLTLPDGFIDPLDREQAGAVAAVIRSLRPRWIVTAPDAVRHPDHVATPDLVARAAFLARLAAWQPGAPEHRTWSGGEPLPDAAETWAVETLLAVCGDNEAPSLYFDITGAWERKQQALACYASQFERAPGRRATMINDAAFMERIERRARTWGRRAGCAFAEALCTRAAPVHDDLPGARWA